MPKRKFIPSEEPLVVSRPQRNTRAKKVFDPSDSYLPKRRNKPALNPEKPETNKKNNQEKRKAQNTKSKNNAANESLDCSSSDFSESLEHSSSNSPEKHKSPELCQKNSNICFLCTKPLLKYELVDCPICLVKVHRNCLLVDEPIWKFKLDKCTWLCQQCRKTYCSKCLKNDSNVEISRRCITCKVGLHLDCYESYDIKPLHTLQINMYVCIPCMTLAIHKLPEEEDDVKEEDGDEYLQEEEEEEREININKGFKEKEEEEEEEEEERETREINKKKYLEEDIISSSSSANLTSSDKEDDDFCSMKSYDSLLDFDRDQDFTPDIPDISNWSKYQIYEYLTDRLPKEILAKIIKNDIDGAALRLLKRTDITFGMGLKLGPALKFYKEVRILQTQSTYHGVFWE